MTHDVGGGDSGTRVVARDVHADVLSSQGRRGQQLILVRPSFREWTHVADDLLDRVDPELVDTVSAGLTGDGDLGVVNAERRNIISRRS